MGIPFWCIIIAHPNPRLLNPTLTRMRERDADGHGGRRNQCADAGLYTNNFPVRILEDSSASENDRCLLVPFKTASNIKDKHTANCGCAFGSDGALTTVRKPVASSSTHSNTPVYLDTCLLPLINTSAWINNIEHVGERALLRVTFYSHARSTCIVMLHPRNSKDWQVYTNGKGSEEDGF